MKFQLNLHHKSIINLNLKKYVTIKNNVIQLDNMQIEMIICQKNKIKRLWPKKNIMELTKTEINNNNITITEALINLKFVLEGTQLQYPTINWMKASVRLRKIPLKQKKIVFKYNLTVKLIKQIT